MTAIRNLTRETVGGANAALPPGPDIPAIAQSERFTQEPLSFLDECRETWGPTFTLRMLGMPPAVVVSEPDLIQQVVQDEATFDGADGNRSTRVQMAVGQYFLMVLKDDLHRDVSTALRECLAHARKTALPRVRQLLLRRLGGWSLNRPFSLLDVVQELALHVMLEVAIGEARDASDRDVLVQRMLSMLMTSVVDGRPNFAACLLTYFSARQKVYDMLDDEIAWRRPRGREGRSDLLSRLVDYQFPNHTGAALTHEQLRDQLMAMSITGHDTTAATTGFAFHEVLRSPDVQAWIAQECEQIALLENPTPADLSNTPRLDAVLAETMRLHPVSPNVNRLTTREAQLGPWRLPAGVMVCPSLYLAHRSVEHFGDDAHEFRPERFVGRRADFAFIPFGGGMRRCIGEHFAKPEIKVILANTLYWARLSLTSRDTHTLRRGFVLAPGNGVTVAMTERKRFPYR